MDRSVRPSRDFYRFAGGGWMTAHPLPADKSRWGAFAELSEQNYRKLRRILESAARARGAPPRSPRRQIGDLYASALDRPERERRGLRPLARHLAAIDRIRSTRQLVRAWAALHAEGISVGFRVFVAADKKATSHYGLYLFQGGLALPDRDYYLRPAFRGVRSEYRRHLARMFRLLGEDAATAERSAAGVFALETRLARSSRSRTALRDEERNYHRVSPRQLARSGPALHWPTFLRALGARRLRRVIVGQPEYFRALGREIRSRPLAAWRSYLRWHLLHASAPHLTQRLQRENFEFFHRRLLGQERPEPPWKLAARVVDGRLGEALGRFYVERYFPPATRAAALELVGDLKRVFRDRLRELAWMTPATRARALAKFARFTTKIGHPARFRSYAAVRIDRADYLGNVRRADAFEVRRTLRQVGRRVDRAEWGMTPPIVNAYFDSTQNQIVFPAGILQPPFFDPRLDPAVNYGAIGVVIGHEITHGYDDRGRRHDADGNLADWWVPRDAREFDRRARRVVAEYDAYAPLPGTHVNGELTLGENIADIGGVRVAFEALRRRLARNPREARRVDGLSPSQRFFVAHAQLWRENCRPEERRRLLTTDPHAPAPFRATGPIRQLDEFFEAFGVRPGDPMWRPPSDRVAIW